MTLKELNALVAQAESEIRELTTSLDTLLRMGDKVALTVTEIEGKGPTVRVRVSNNRIANLLRNRLDAANEAHAGLFAKVAQVNALLETLP